ncbi:MAG TPA: hypothetical protein VFY39_16315 [Gammaproteobacteria bacterium]|nr:hypothetical protein [Gammaproteobacteria bacterium]
MNARFVLAAFVLSAAPAGAAEPSDLGYTYIDFRVIDKGLDATGTQNPIPEQQVQDTARGGSGISVAGSLALPKGLYMAGRFDSSIVDVDTRIVSPLAEQTVADKFDLTESRFSVGYRHPLGPKLDLIGELGYESAQLDFGSLAGENFDTHGTGVAIRAGFRWNPAPAFEVYATGGRSPVGELSLDERRLSPATVVNAGIRWYFFQDLGVGLNYQSGALSALTLSMRFGFGDLPW